jgi:DnaJ-class molecular chaperone
MTSERGDQRCEKCKGSGKVPLLISLSKCPDCEGTGKIVDEEADTAPLPVSRGVTQGSPPRDRCDEEDDPSYFDDGLEFDDYDWYGGGDGEPWEGDD